MQRKVLGQRLAYYQQAASANHWDEVWHKNISAEFYQLAHQGKLGYFEEIFPEFLPKKGLILEAGCGLAQYVLALQQRGYDIEGVEWGHKTVELVNSILPDLRIRQGDVTNLEVPDENYAGYISLGVVEHREEGPQAFLKEAHRVLTKEGIAFFSVPYFHSIRKSKAKLGFYTGNDADKDFYQYAFTDKEFIGILEDANFEVLKKMPYDGYKGTKDELPFLKSLFILPKIGWRIRRFFERSSWIEQRFGHMVMFACRKH